MSIRPWKTLPKFFCKNLSKFFGGFPHTQEQNEWHIWSQYGHKIGGVEDKTTNGSEKVRSLIQAAQDSRIFLWGVYYYFEFSPSLFVFFCKWKMVNGPK